MSVEAIKKALEGVTPGPWELCAHLKHNDACSCGYRGVIYGPEPDGFAICQPGHEPAPEGQEGTEPPRYPRDVEIANMRYIAAVNPAAISELLSTLESLQRENEELTSGIKRLSDEDELLAETTGDMVSVVKLAAKLALSETHVNELQKANVAYVDANTALIRENEALKKDRYDLAYAITGGEDAPGLLDSVPTSQLVEIARDTHRRHSADIDRAEAAEAEMKRMRGELAFYSCDGSTCDCISGQEDANSVTCGFRARTALASTGGEHHAE